MPSYKVISKGFHGGHLYDPQGKRRVLHTEKPFVKNKKEYVPSWLETIKPETAAQAKARKGAETKAANAEKKKAADDKKEIDSASFMGDGEAPKSNAVETL